ncbi:MAG: hypothetical protein A3E78_11985 [Alphaproteobacteria bacterium RIFCSPHIGHO2_12_FULL_63_12]|nr:MAG: hypothetical protein A3E78_11985 [Alphaproteobacteria bacterium RIFCSPHIGHO2_12_FULL_63_12]
MSDAPPTETDIRYRAMQFALSLPKVGPLDAATLANEMGDFFLEKQEPYARINVATLVFQRWGATMTAAQFMQTVRAMATGVLEELPG